MKKILKKVHLWLAIPSGIIIGMLCLTGAIMVFQADLLRLLNHDRYYVDEVKDEMMPFETLLPMVHEAFPGAEMEGVFLFGDPKRTFSFDFETAKNTSIEVDPYTGQIRAVIFPGYDGFNGSDGFFDVVTRLHQNLLVRTNRGEFAWGSFINGVATLIFFFIIVTGIVIWAPKKIKSVKERMKVNLKKGGFRFWYDLHLAGGIVAAIFLLLMVLTALDFSFDWYHRGLVAIVGAGSEPTQVQPTAQQPIRQEALGTDNVEDLQKIGKSLDVLYQRLRRDYPDATDMGFKFGGSGFVSMNHRKINTNISFDPGTGEIRKTQLFKDMSRDGKLEWIIELIHTGTWAGNFSRSLYLLACLIGTILPMTGYYFYIRKQIKKSKRKKT